MRSLKRVIVWIAAVMGIGCGGGNTRSNVYPGDSARCIVTLSGAVSGTADCRPATTTSSSPQSVFQSGVTSSESDGGADFSMTVVIFFLGAPAARTYARTDPGAEGGVAINSAAGTWTTLSGGSYQLTFTSVSDRVNYPEGAVYDGEGTLDATVPANLGSGANGTVKLHAIF